MKSRNVLLGTLAGVATGALVGLLLAPEKGSSVRKNILDKSKGYADSLKDKFEDFMDSSSQKFEATRHDAKDLAAKSKSRFEDGKKEFKNSIL